MFTISLPATSANLGPAFDAAALAFPLRLTLTAEPAANYKITARGRDAKLCGFPSGDPQQHLILSTYEDVLAREGRAITPLRIQLKNEIPIGKGCGSSAAARLAGIGLAVHFGKLKWSPNRIMTEASLREHHPDNATACWLGGITLARMEEAPRNASEHDTGVLPHLEVVRVVPKGKWPLLLAVPSQPLSTEEARKVLPKTYSRADVVVNVQSSLFLLAAFFENRGELLRYGLDDRIHQPYRSKLCPLLAPLQELAADPASGLFGAALSGAGPSVLAFLNPKFPATKTRLRVAAYLKTRGLKAELFLTAIAEKGAEGLQRKKQ